MEVIIPTSASQEIDVVDIYLNKTDDENVLPEQQAPKEKTDEVIEVEKAVSSPLKEMQVEPSGSNKEDDKVEGEQNASRGNTTPVTSSGAPTQMEVDPAPGSLASQPEQEEKKSEEPMAHEQVVPPVAPKETKKDVVVTQVSEEVVVPPTVECPPKEKTLVPDSQRAVKGVLVKRNEGQTSASMPSTPEKSKGPLLHLSPSVKMSQHMMLRRPCK